MSYDATAHDAQMAILKHLLLVPSAGFAELQKNTDLTSDHFNFHIKKLVESGFVEKSEDGAYVLSRAGKEYANRMDTDEKQIEKQPKISVALIVEDGLGRVLAQQRLKQPYFGYWGRPTGKIRWGEEIEQAAARELLEETGLTADLRVAGIYHKMDYDQTSGDMLEDKIFLLVHGTNPKGELIVDGEGCHNEWLSDDEFHTKDKVFQSVKEITAMVQKPELQFMEHKYEYDPREY